MHKIRLQKLRILKFRTKNALFGYFRTFPGWNFKKPLSYLKSTPSNLSNCKILQKKQKYLNLEPKILIWVFLGWNWIEFCQIWNQHPRTCLLAKFREKMKTPKFGAKMSYLGILELEFGKAIVIFEIKLLNLSHCKISWKKG